MPSIFTALRQDLCGFQLLDGFGVGGVLVDGDHTRNRGVRSRERLVEKAFGRLGIPGGTEPELEGVPMRIQRPIHIHPLLFDFAGGLLDPPRVCCRLEMGRHRRSK